MPDIQNLCIFTKEELELILYGDAKQGIWMYQINLVTPKYASYINNWMIILSCSQLEEISNHITFGGGYTSASDPIVKVSVQHF